LALQQQRDWLDVTLASIGDAVIATDAQGRIILFNPIAESLTGWPVAEALGQRSYARGRLLLTSVASDGDGGDGGASGDAGTRRSRR
jgi:PAS domain-containing protein